MNLRFRPGKVLYLTSVAVVRIRLHQVFLLPTICVPERPAQLSAGTGVAYDDTMSTTWVSAQLLDARKKVMDCIRMGNVLAMLQYER